MAFDRNDPADLLALKTEVNTDPIGMGYDPAGNTNQLLRLLNDPDNNVGGETATRPFDATAMLDAFDPTDLDAQQAIPGTDTYTQILVAQSSVAGLDIEPYKAKWRGLFTVIPSNATVPALDAQNVTLSRAEVLFGQGTVISREDWAAARDS